MLNIKQVVENFSKATSKAEILETASIIYPLRNEETSYWDRASQLFFTELVLLDLKKNGKTSLSNIISLLLGKKYQTKVSKIIAELSSDNEVSRIALLVETLKPIKELEKTQQEFKK